MIRQPFNCLRAVATKRRPNSSFELFSSDSVCRSHHYLRSSNNNLYPRVRCIFCSAEQKQNRRSLHSNIVRSALRCCHGLCRTHQQYRYSRHQSSPVRFSTTALSSSLNSKYNLAIFHKQVASSIASFTSKTIDGDKGKKTRKLNTSQETAGSTWEIDPSFPTPTKFYLIKTKEERRRLLYCPIGSLLSSASASLESNDDNWPDLLKSFELGEMLVDYEYANSADANILLERQKFLYQYKRPIGRRLVRVGHDDDSKIKSRGRIDLDWPYLTDICMEGWILLLRILDEWEYRNKNGFQLSVINEGNEESHRSGLNAGDPSKLVLSPWPLMLWRKIYKYEVPLGGPCQRLLPQPSVVYPIVVHCLEQNLWNWFPDMGTAILDVIQCTTDADPSQKQTGAFLAQKVFDSILTLPPSSPLDVSSSSSPAFSKGQVPSASSSTFNNQLDRDSHGLVPRPRYPHRMLINKLIGIWYRSGHVDAPHYAMRLLQLLIRLHQMFPNNEVYHPDSYVYAAVIHCWGQDPYQPSKNRKKAAKTNFDHDDEELFDYLAQQTKAIASTMALSLFKEALHKYNVELTKGLYDAVFQCLSRSHDPVSQRLASDLLRERVRRWKTLYHACKDDSIVSDYRRATNQRKKHEIQITSQTFFPMIVSFCRNGQVHQAVGLLLEMETLADGYEEPAFLPSTECYDVVLSTLKRKVQAHGSDHTRYPFLRWNNQQSQSPSTLPFASSSFETEARETLKQIQEDLYVVMDDENANPAMVVRDAFCLFDTVAQECFQPNSRILSSHFFPWPTSVLDMAIQAWKRMRQMVLKKGHNPADDAANDKDSWGPNCRPPGTNPRWLLNRLNNYCAVELFRPSGDTLDFMLTLVQSCAPKQNDTFTAHILASALISFLEDKCGDPAHDVDFPDAKIYCRLMRIWYKSIRYHEHVRGEKRHEITAMENIIRSLTKWYRETGNPNFRPTAEMYAMLVDTWIKIAGVEENLPEVVARRGQDAWDAYERLDVGQQIQLSPEIIESEREGKSLLFDTVIRARSTMLSARQTMELFDEILQKLRNSNLESRDPGFVLFYLVERLGAKFEEPTLCEDAIHKLEGFCQETGDSSLKPTTKCYNALIKAYGCKGLFDQMEQIYGDMCTTEVESDLKNIGPASVDPDIDTHHAVLRAWAKNGSSAEIARHAVDLYRQLNSSQPSSSRFPIAANVTTLNLVLECLLSNAAASAASGDNDTHDQKRGSFVAAKEASALVEGVETDAVLGTSFRPNDQTYLTYMTLLQKSLMPDKSFQVLKRFCELCENGTVLACPDVRHFNVAIEAYVSACEGCADAHDCDNKYDAFSRVCEVFRMMLEGSYVFRRFAAVHPESRDFAAEPNESTYRGMLQIAMKKASTLQGGMERILRSEAVLQAMVEQKWHENPENKDAAVKMFQEVHDSWREEEILLSPSNEQNSVVLDMLRPRIQNLEKLIEGTQQLPKQ